MPSSLILLGPPGSGKGTQASLLVAQYGLRHVSAGALLRREVEEMTPLGIQIYDTLSEGGLVSDEVVMDLVEMELHSGVLLDGFPRTLSQAEFVNNALSPDLAILLEVPEEELVRRLSLRGLTSGRPDDHDEGVIRRRIADDARNVDQVLAELECRVVRIPGLGTPQEVFGRISCCVDDLQSSPPAGS